MGGIRFIDVTVGIKVLICPDEVQKNLFHQNFGCCRKVHNVLISKYNDMHEKDNTITPTYTFLNKLLNKTKKRNCLIFMMLTQPVYNSPLRIYPPVSVISLKTQNISILPFSTAKEKPDQASDKQYQPIKKSSKTIN